MMIDPKLWHQAKVKTGSRSSRKIGTKSVKGHQSAQKRIRATYDEMIKARDTAALKASQNAS